MEEVEYDPDDDADFFAEVSGHLSVPFANVPSLSSLQVEEPDILDYMVEEDSRFLSLLPEEKQPTNRFVEMNRRTSVCSAATTMSGSQPSDVHDEHHEQNEQDETDESQPNELTFDDITPESLSPATDFFTNDAFEEPKKVPNFIKVNKLKVRLASLAVRLRKNLSTNEILVLMKEISDIEVQLGSN